MMLPRWKTTWLGIVLAAGACAGQAFGQTTLRYKFQVGENLNYQVEQKMAMKMDVGGQAQNIDMGQTLTFVWHVNQVDRDGNAKMTQKIESVQMTMDTPMGKMEYDSKSGKEMGGPFGPILNPIMKALAGAQFSLDMDPQGKPSHVQVPETLLDQIKKTPGLQAMGDMFSEEGLKRMVAQGGLVLPREPASKGTAWNDKAEIKMPFGTMKVDTRYTFDGPVMRQGKELEEISLKPNVTMEPGQGGAFAVKLKEQDASGKAYFDNTAGRLVESTTKQDMNMEITAGGMTINQKIEQTTTLKLVNK
jgi:Family of unknown function (DUF6263)